MHRRRFLTGLGALAAMSAAGPLLSACGSSGTASAKEHRSSVARAAPTENDLATAALLARENAAFGWSLFDRLAAGETGNLFLSPYSIGVAMAMVQAGARGNTAAEIATALRFAAAGDQLHGGMNGLQEAVTALPAAQRDVVPFELSVANSAWTQSGHPFESAFLDALARYYGAGAWQADFKGDPDGTRERINDWVEDQTNDRIQDLLPEGTVTPLTRLVLANAVYFKADWVRPFEKDATRLAPFTPLNGTAVDVDAMFQQATFPYAQIGAAQALELQYAGESTSMVLILPDAGAFPDTGGQLAKLFEDLIASLSPRLANVTLPKWEYSSEFGLAEALKDLGVIDAFDPDAADLSGMDGTRDLYISAVQHKAFVRVDEKGTEAAAATGVVAGTTSAPTDPPVDFTVDRPFYYIIRHRDTGANLFIGQVTNPAS